MSADIDRSKWAAFLLNGFQCIPALVYTLAPRWSLTRDLTLKPVAPRAAPPAQVKIRPPRVISRIPKSAFGRSLTGRPLYLRWSKQRLPGTSGKGWERPEVNSGEKFFLAAYNAILG